jgi:hypothetical protein
LVLVRIQVGPLTPFREIPATCPWFWLLRLKGFTFGPKKLV